MLWVLKLFIKKIITLDIYQVIYFEIMLANCLCRSIIQP